MQRILILGAGTAGTMAANHLRKELGSEYEITIVDQDETHYYQPGFLFIPFGTYQPSDVVKPTADFLRKGISYVNGEVASLEPTANTVLLADGRTFGYDHLIIATGTHPTLGETPGLDSDEYGKTVHDFFSLESAVALQEALESFKEGRLVVSLIEMPIKCPVAPLEFAFLAEAHFTDLGIRDKVEIVYVTPMSSVFTKPVASEQLGDMFEQRGIHLEPDFYLERVDAEAKMLVSYDEREVPYDLLVTVPINMGASFVGAAGIGDELNHVRVDPGNFQSPDYPNIFALGDAASLPTSKAGSVAHFAMDTFVPNFVDYLRGLPMKHEFDGHANCYIETGHDKAMLIDFNYKTQPLPGKYPVPGIGPFSLLEESKVNHRGKLAFRWMYWNLLLPGRHLPVSSEMSMAGKDTDLA
ncbi:MAG: NAD(P)/FAD-dependent oxidoreductase [Armatimonadetes bacterium]|nr:MAG: NAD(P)/FAD-dependent oxidoreductase [Armatimonadota bacterium]